MVSESSNLIFLAGIPVWGRAMVALGAMVVWATVHRMRQRPGSMFRGWRAVVAGATIGFIALLATLQTLEWWLTYTTQWPLWIPAGLGAVGVEACAVLYSQERRILRRRGIRRLLIACRIGLILLITLMLAQPVRVAERTRSIDRTVAILLDNTPSMSIADPGMTIVERLRLAEAMGVPHGIRPYRIEAAVTNLAVIATRLTAQSEWLDSLQGLPDDDRAEQLESERRRLHAFFETQVESLRDAMLAVAAARDLAGSLDGPHDDLAGLTSRIEQSLIAPLSELTKKTRPESMPARWWRRLRDRADRHDTPPVTSQEPDSREHGGTDPADPPVTNEIDRVEIAMASIYESSRRTLTDLTAELADIAETLRHTGETLDQAFYRQLSETAKASVDAVAQQPREALARDLLLGNPGAGTDAARAGFIRRLLQTHPVKLYRTAETTASLDVDAWRESTATDRQIPAIPHPASVAPDGAPMDEPDNGNDAAGKPSVDETVFKALIDHETRLATRGRKTDLRSAINHVTHDIPSEQLNAVIILSDMRHQADGSPEAPAQRLALRDIPVYPVVFGMTNPPPDAAIVAVDSPDTILSGDRARFALELRLDGLTNQTVDVRLLNGADVVDTQTVQAENDGERRRVALVDRPETIGLNHYRIELDFDAREVVATNNVFHASVNVSEDPAYLLLIDGRPTWEFRYLKNLFSGRDPWTRLQYVLLEPRTIPGEPARETVAASVARAIGENAGIEATALPDSIEEWLKFDAVILGDVAPDRFSDADWEALTVFVTQRGGTLIVLAGPHAMPHAYEPGPLRDLLPVHPLRTQRALMRGPEPNYTLRLTPDGEADPMMRLAADPAENLAIWAGMPPIYWRQSIVRVREAATVLAYAAPPDTPDFMQQPAIDPRLAERQRDYHRAHALVTHHQVGLGNVLFLGFNHTWRLRFRTGDTFHHRFWGQIMRWATAYKMPFGTGHIRMGTGQARYPAGEPVRIRARLLHRDHTPFISDDVAVDIRQGTERVTRRTLRYLDGSPGIYETEIDALPPGTYTANLDAPVDDELMAAFQAMVETTPPAFTIADGIGPEWIELAPDRDLAGRLADLTGGRLMEPADLDGIIESLGPGRIEQVERKQWEIWTSWPMLSLLALLAGVEWFFRKRERLP